MNRDAQLLRHILESISWIREFASGGRETYVSDRKTQSAVLRELQTLAESAQRLSAETRAKRPEIFWQGIAGFRNVLVHDYLGINHERVWAIVVEQIPKLEVAVKALLAEQDAEEESKGNEPLP